MSQLLPGRLVDFLRRVVAPLQGDLDLDGPELAIAGVGRVAEHDEPALTGPLVDEALDGEYVGLPGTDVADGVLVRGLRLRCSSDDGDRGVGVVVVVEDAPAAAALQGSDRLEQVGGQRIPVGGDVIVAVEGQPVASAEDVASVLLAETRPGEEVELTIVRDGERTNVTTTVTERPDPGSTTS